MELKIKTIRNSYLRNNEHFQFNTEFRDLVVAETAEKLKITTPFDNYIICYNNEDVALQKITKSATTEQIDAADKLRDPTFRGMVDTNRAAINHYEELVRAAAKRIQVVFDTYGNVAALPLNEETSAIYNLLQELSTNYSADMRTVGISGWASTLGVQNAEFDALVKSRNDERAGKTELKMKETRAETDNAYNAIVTLVNALIVVEGAENYETFVRKLNSYIEQYNTAVAQRYGRNKAKKEKEEETD